ncbi:methyltransferase domain-containing protein [Heliobacterium gestii]|uniref:Methyltransferase domain-containing protein n=1 Tax=Heliomicrobium gestii TaxID=2699 RepID=A0A845LHY0_HELGE|nr:class I SAM-dependent methyltransferase [Heliomicrobium gestii]MBM7867786.1 SAM-dependent methyltransferase [Heliomicrobium gestii]MZP44179.1 methyltransferase domain-containing protein [Heliomicrobium gestii]
MNLYEALFPFYDTVFPVKAPVVDFLAGQFSASPAVAGSGSGESVTDGGSAPGGLRLLDAACGTGGHALALAKRGFSLSAIDLQAEMIAVARQKAEGLASPPRFAVMDMSAVYPETLGRWDGVYCIGNSLPHLGDMTAIRRTLARWAAGMRTGRGTIVIQVVNFAHVLAKGGQLPTLEGTQAGRGVRFERRYEPGEEGRIRFLTRLIVREADEAAERADEEWTAETQLLPLSPLDLSGALSELGYDDLRWFGDLTGKERRADSPAVVVVAHKA